MGQRVRGMGRFKDEERALTKVGWKMKELRWYGVNIMRETEAILEGIRVCRLERVAA